jgi:NTP pyrophosphatase (non-canonical NTP hydrolase)
MDLRELTEAMHAFVAAKGWYAAGSPRPQTPRNLAASLSIEAAEVLELFQWGERAPTPELAGELADVALYLLQLASLSGIDLEQAILDKLRLNYARTWDTSRATAVPQGAPSPAGDAPAGQEAAGKEAAGKEAEGKATE